LRAELKYPWSTGVHRNNPSRSLSNWYPLSIPEERIVKIPVFVMVLAAAMLAGLGLIFFVL
jgi:hypothetical protein